MLFSKIAIWGDSLLKGVIYDERRNAHRLLKQSVANEASKSIGVSLLNFAQMGCTIRKGYEYMKRHLNADYDAALIEFGGNDCDFNWAEIAQDPQKDHSPNTPLSEFGERLRDMAASLRNIGKPFAFVNLPPLSPERYLNFVARIGLNKENILKWLGDVHYIYRYHESYSCAITQVANDIKCPVVDLRSPFLAKRRYEDYLCLDGIHPNALGHGLMRETFERFVQTIHCSAN